MLLAYMALGGSALWIIYQDVREQTIPWLGLILFGLASLSLQMLTPNPEGLWVSGVIGIIFITLTGIFYLIKRQPVLGWGDLILSPFCGLWLFLPEIPIYLVSTGIMALLMGLLWRYRWGMRTFPMAPSLLLGLGIVLLIRCFLTRNGI